MLTAHESPESGVLPTVEGGRTTNTTFTDAMPVAKSSRQMIYYKVALTYNLNTSNLVSIIQNITRINNWEVYIESRTEDSENLILDLSKWSTSLWPLLLLPGKGLLRTCNNFYSDHYFLQAIRNKYHSNNITTMTMVMRE